MRNQRTIILAILGAISFVMVGTLVMVWLARTAPILGSPEAPGSNVGPEGLSVQQTSEADQLPEHPFEHMGVAGLSPSTGMPENAITEARAIDIVTESTWGEYHDELVKCYPPSAAPAVYNAQESAMGPAADGRPVWVVTLEGWAPAGRCGPGDLGPPGPEDPSARTTSEPASEREPFPTINNAYVIVDAVSGQHLGGWHYTRCGKG